ncbi:MAG: type II secretion system F family protein [Mycobacteriales bacterium]
MGLAIGGLLGLGLALLVFSGSSPGTPPALLVARRRRSEALLTQAGIRGVTPGQLRMVTVGGGLLVAILVFALTGTAAVAVAFGVFAGRAPRAYLARRGRQRAALYRDLWPDVVDNLASSIRAGMSLPEAVGAIGETGPAPIRPPFVRFAEAHRVSGSFPACLDGHAAELADPVADRVVEALRLAREVGGSDLGGLLRTLSGFLREEARTRAEIEARQSWTVNAARLALAAPWFVLLLLATQSTTIRAYNRPAGVVVLAVGGGVSYLAYRLMRRLGRLPDYSWAPQ